MFANMKHDVTSIIDSFEEGAITEAVALARLHETTGRTVDPDWLRDYWRSESLEDFVDRLCAEPIVDWERITDTEALALMAEFTKTDSPGRRDSIEIALDRRYGKPSGTLSGLVRQQDIAEPSKILGEMKKDTRIYL